MTNFSINFANPWLLLLLIPAIVLTLLPYFQSNKRYRKTRNRIVSIVLHLIIMVLSISVLAGATFEYDLANEENEVILLVDSSFSNENQVDNKNEFIQGVISSNNKAFKLGIVSFGYDQVLALPLTDDMTNAFNTYLKAPLPDTSATDIEAALLYAADQFNFPETSRIVLLTGASETDGKALDVVRQISSRGIKIDTVYFPENEPDTEVQVIGMELPETKIKRAEDFTVQLVIQSSYTGTALITPYSDEAPMEPQTVDLKEGIHKVKVNFNLTTPGLHPLTFEITSNSDTLVQNNTYISYVYIESFNNVLIVESIENESLAIVRMLGTEFDTTVIGIADEKLPKTVEELREYDEVILCNISNEDMPDGFDKILYTYVEEIGGGLFTVCGNEQGSTTENWVANAYREEDMKGTLYQKLLPVEIIDYTPPVAVMVLIDSSGSMIDPNDPDAEDSRLWYAKQGAEACLGMLSDRDYIGVYSLADYETEQLKLTPVTRREDVLAAIYRIEGGGGTIFSSALEKAGDALLSCSDVEKRHIIIITDGEPSQHDVDRTKSILQENAAEGITTSIVGIETGDSADSLMTLLLTQYANVSENNYHDVNDVSEVADAVREDLAAPEITDVNYETFTPIVKVTGAITEGVDLTKMPTLDGFYGMKAKEKTEANQLEVILSTTYTPLYTQWIYGKGRVGTFACDLNGTWSADFIDTPEGNTILQNIVSALLPLEDIRLKSIEMEVVGDNYKNVANIYTELLDGEYYELTITSPSENSAMPDEVQVITADKSDNYTKLTFSITTPGVHTIVVKKKNDAGQVLAEATQYKALAYSLEYQAFVDSDANEALIEEIAAGGKGYVLESPWQVYDNAAIFLHKVIDPAMAFLITMIVLFLLDIAVRKFKWKWPHELVREHRAKQAMENKQ